METLGSATGLATSVDLDKVPKSDGTTSWNATALAAIKAQVVSALIAVSAVIDTILAILVALPTLIETGGTVTTDGNEQNIYINDAPDGVFAPRVVNIDCTNHTATESITISTYYRIKSGGNYILQDTVSYALMVISPELVKVELDPNRYGVKVTIQKTAGTNRAYDWEVLYEA